MKLPSLVCECGRLLQSDDFVPNARGGAPRASGYDSCLRRCDVCAVGYSNASSSNLGDLQRILREPFPRLSAWLYDDLDYALDHCLHQANGHPKKKRSAFHSFASEDHATWVVMRALQREGLLGPAFGFPKLKPTILIWGVPIPKALPAGDRLRAQLLRVLRDRLKEKDGWFTEPDVVLDFGDEITIIEAKLTSANDRKKPDYGGWKTYLNSAAFRHPARAIDSQLYQLARNWRIAYELADGRPFQVVNLAPAFPKKEHRSLAMLRSSLSLVRGRRLTLKTWQQVCKPLKNLDWIRRYGEERGLWLAH